MDIKLNASVECVDGKSSGHVTGAIINPENNELTHLVIKTRGIERVVPANLIHNAIPNGVLLECSLASLDEQTPLVDTEYIRSVVEHFDIGLNYIKPRYSPETYIVKHEHIPDGELEIKHGMAVFAQDGLVGHIDDVVVDSVSDHITHIILREGHLWGAKDVVVARNYIKSIEDDGV
jgi:sporulation protein YlmC with PRC-barrel domain